MEFDAAEACAFCAIVAGRTPATIIAADDLTVSFLDLRQFHPGHVLVVPRAHVSDVRQADDATAASLMVNVARMARAVSSTFPNEGLSIWHSIGPAADQEVPHLHVHVHARRLDDGLLRVYPRAPPHPDRGTLDEWGTRLRTVLSAVVVFVFMSVASAVAQPAPRFEAGAQVVASTVPGFDGSDFGLGGRLAWRTDDVLSFEGELNLFPGKFPDTGVAVSRRRMEGLFGVTAGLRFGRLRPFAKFRAGFVDVQEAPEPFACILIFPPPLSCTLGAGRTLPAFDLGGGVQVDVTPRTFIRVEGGDRMVKYPGPAIDDEGIHQADSFYGQGFRFAAGVGMRF
jgi:histidine triad (HIT) family protein